MQYTPLFNKQHPLLFDKQEGFAAAAAGASGANASAFAASRITVLRSQGRQLFNADASDGAGTPATAASAGDGGGTPAPSEADTQARSVRSTVPRGKCMTPSDIRFVVNRTMQPMESTDPYSDDFYFLQVRVVCNYQW